MGPSGPSQRSQSLLRVERVPLCRSHPHQESLELTSGTRAWRRKTDAEERAEHVRETAEHRRGGDGGTRV